MVARPANPELRSEILKAAAFIVEDCGSDCVTMREVAEKVGYSATTIYLYFKDKSALLRATVHAAFEDFTDACESAVVGPRVLDKLRQRSRAYVVWGILHPGHYRLMFEYSEDLRFSEEDVDAMNRSLSPWHALAQDAIDAGELSADADAAQIAHALWTALHGATSLAISGRLVPKTGGAQGARVVEAATGAADLLLNSLLESAAA